MTYESPLRGRNREAAREAKREGEVVPVQTVQSHERLVSSNDEQTVAERALQIKRRNANEIGYIAEENEESRQNNVQWIKQEMAEGMSSADAIQTLRDNDWSDEEILEMLTAAFTTTSEEEAALREIGARAVAILSASIEREKKAKMQKPPSGADDVPHGADLAA